MGFLGSRLINRWLCNPEPQCIFSTKESQHLTYHFRLDGFSCLGHAVQTLADDGQYFTLDLSVHPHALPHPAHPPLLHLLYPLQDRKHHIMNTQYAIHGPSAKKINIFVISQ